jgi:hypothetical protein
MKASALRYCSSALWLALLSTSFAEVSYEVDANYSFTGRQKMNFGSKHPGGSVSEQSGGVCAVVSPQVGEGLLLRIGADVENYAFSLSPNAPVPSTLQSANLILGFDWQLLDAWLLRVEAQPGFYGSYNNATADGFNIPITVGGVYFAGADLQWILGALINKDNFWPVVPAVGARWNFTEGWVLNAVLPSPKLEYTVAKGVVLYTGFDIKGGTFRTPGDFGTNRGNTALNNAVLDYYEVRAGAGTEWKVLQNVTLDLSAGFLPYRTFNYTRVGTNYESDGGAAYGQVSLSARF